MTLLTVCILQPHIHSDLNLPLAYYKLNTHSKRSLSCSVHYVAAYVGALRCINEHFFDFLMFSEKSPVARWLVHTCSSELCMKCEKQRVKRTGSGMGNGYWVSEMITR